MIVCGQCGERSERKVEFCGACGAFLEWDSAIAETAQPPDPRPHTIPDPERHTPDPRRHAPEPEQRAPESAQPKAVQPVAVQPTATEPPPITRRPQPEPEDRRPLPGELICGFCGSGNDPKRRFCRRCGTSLAEAPVVPPPPWWKRIFRRKTYEAGTRRDVSQPRQWRRPILILAALLLILIFLAVPALRSLPGRGYTALLDRVKTHNRVVPASARASSSAAGAGPDRVYDGHNDRYWATALPGPGGWVEAEFAKPMRLLDIIVTPGVSADQKVFVADGRPAELRVEAFSSTGDVVTARTLKLVDAPGPQTFSVKASDTARVRITIKGVYGPGTRPPAIAELEFFGR
ncbi:discoidin domain-containing protein [Longispora albida]|uniref:discoidin domain-containing protein n=1 Tax=Longispora albida TaxID=203523 RepID=UPI00039DD152|nr:discoidin domain-containing protein [Longispora albida]